MNRRFLSRWLSITGALWIGCLVPTSTVRGEDPLPAEWGVWKADHVEASAAYELAENRANRLRMLFERGHASWAETAAAECETAKCLAVRDGLDPAKQTWRDEIVAAPANAAHGRWVVCAWPGDEGRTVWVDTGNLNPHSLEFLHQLRALHDLEVARFEVLGQSRQSDVDTLRERLERLSILPPHAATESEKTLVRGRLRVAESRVGAALARHDRERARRTALDSLLTSLSQPAPSEKRESTGLFMVDALTGASTAEDRQLVTAEFREAAWRRDGLRALAERGHASPRALAVTELEVGDLASEVRRVGGMLPVPAPLPTSEPTLAIPAPAVASNTSDENDSSPLPPAPLPETRPTVIPPIQRFAWASQRVAAEIHKNQAEAEWNLRREYLKRLPTNYANTPDRERQHWEISADYARARLQKAVTQVSAIEVSDRPVKLASGDHPDRPPCAVCDEHKLAQFTVGVRRLRAEAEAQAARLHSAESTAAISGLLALPAQGYLTEWQLRHSQLQAATMAADARSAELLMERAKREEQMLNTLERP